MRSYLLAFVHVAAAFWIGCGDVLSPKRAEAPSPNDAIGVDDHFSRPVLAKSVNPDTLSVDALNELDATINELMMQINVDSVNVSAMRKLAWLYTAHGWHDRAIGPLARAQQLAPGDEEIRAELESVIQRLGWAEDEREYLLAEEAANFAEVVAYWGHEC